MVDPFLLIDEMGPVEYGPGEAVGAPTIHTGVFETVTYALAANSSTRTPRPSRPCSAPETCNG